MADITANTAWGSYILIKKGPVIKVCRADKEDDWDSCKDGQVFDCN